MEIKIKNEVLPVCSGICRTKSNFTAECDVIVPDTKPDILKVLQLSARPRVTSCETRGGHVIVSGNISFEILYLADNEEKCVKSIVSSCEFSNLVRDNNITEAMLTFADVDVSELNCNIANCRKLSLKATLCMNVRVYSQCNLDVVTDIEGACTKKERILSDVISAHASDSTIITDNFSLAAGKSPIVEILKSDAQITDSELKVIDDKAIIKGTLRITVLYKSESGLEYAQSESAFAHILEAEGIRSDMDYEHSVKILDITANPASDNEGNACIIEFSTQLFMRVIARTSASVDCVVDAYMPHGALDCSFSPISVDNIETVIRRDVDFREKICLPEALPPIETVYQIIASPFTQSCVPESGKLIVSGYTEVYLLYLSSDESHPVCSHKMNIDFSVECDSPGCMLTPVATSKLRNISYTLSSDNCVELRGCLDVNVQCIRTSETEIVYSAQAAEYTPVSRPSIIVSCVCPSRTLWDIAKEYAVNPQDILTANAFESESDILPGAALIIPK